MLGNETFVVSSVNIRCALISLKSYLLVTRKDGFDEQSFIENEIILERNQHKITIPTKLTYSSHVPIRGQLAKYGW